MSNSNAIFIGGVLVGAAVTAAGFWFYNKSKIVVVKKQAPQETAVPDADQPEDRQPLSPDAEPPPRFLFDMLMSNDGSVVIQSSDPSLQHLVVETINDVDRITPTIIETDDEENKYCITVYFGSAAVTITGSLIGDPDKIKLYICDRIVESLKSMVDLPDDDEQAIRKGIIGSHLHD